MNNNIFTSQELLEAMNNRIEAITELKRSGDITHEQFTQQLTSLVRFVESIGIVDFDESAKIFVISLLRA